MGYIIETRICEGCGKNVWDYDDGTPFTRVLDVNDSRNKGGYPMVRESHTCGETRMTHARHAVYVDGCADCSAEREHPYDCGCSECVGAANASIDRLNKTYERIGVTERVKPLDSSANTAFSPTPTDRGAK